MNSDASARKRKHRLQLAARTNARTTREHKAQEENARKQPQASKAGMVKIAKDQPRLWKVPDRDIRPTSPTAHDDFTARKFTVGNVGANGTLYLQPMLAPSGLLRPPATPPDTADVKEHRRVEWSDVRYSTITGADTPRLQAGRTSVEHDLTSPPLSIQNGGSRRRQRSHSFSTIDYSRPSTFDARAFNLMLNDKPSARPKSFTGFHSTSILDLNIPSYRLGTPRFGEHGSAYIQGSAYNSMVSGQRSSTISAQEYDRIFPRPPGKATTATFLRPSCTKSGRRTVIGSTAGPISPAIGAANLTNFVQIEANANSPALVRYDTSTYRILAATPARLVAQITSPVFLDYELLSDFFLTYRCFMSANDAMSSILARLEWALSTTTDAGQIVRVRTFVALRHWMLNYFIDDFAHDAALRQQFCDKINFLSGDLQSQSDTSGKVTEMNILEELKKCWRRTCAMFWPSPDSLIVQPGMEIAPGGVPSSPKLMGSTLGRRSSIGTHRLTKDSDEPWQASLRLSIKRNTVQSFEADFAAMTGKLASIPASPMSEESLEVLSCSVPFLRHVQQSSNASKDAPRPVASHRTKTQTDAPSRPRHQHKRSGSFSDALRNVGQSRPPAELDRSDIRSSPAIALTGGLVRGLLLQPSPAKVDVLVPLSPPLEDHNGQHGAANDSYFQDPQQHQNTAVKKIVGEVRRALSARKHRHDSPASSHRSTPSTSSRSGTSLARAERSTTTNGQPLQGLLGRMDMLGARASESYHHIFGHLIGQEANQEGRNNMDNVPEDDEHEDEYNQGGLITVADSADHRLTAGSRSIVIGVDPAIDVDSLVLPMDLQSFRSMSSTMAPDPLRVGPQPSMHSDSFTFPRLDSGLTSDAHASSDARRMAFGSRAASESQLSQKLSMPPPWQEEHLSPENLRDQRHPRRPSSGIELPAFMIDPTIHHLRRIPGGDLKSAEHTHDLQLLPRRHTSGYSFSAYSRSLVPSAYQVSLASGAKHSAHAGQPSWKAFLPRAKSTSLQLLETNSLQAHLRPSYQAQFAHLRRLTPGLDSGGGIEDALLKLEGKVGTPGKTTLDLVEPLSAHDVGTLADSRFGLRDSVDTSRGVKSAYGPSIAPSHEVRSSTQYATESFSANNFLPLDHGLNPIADVQGASISNSCRSSAAMYYGSGPRRAYVGNLAVPSIVQPQGLVTSRPTTHSTRHSFSPPLGDLGWTIGGIDDEFGDLTSLRRRSARLRKSISTLHSLLLDDNESLSDISTEIGGPAEDEDYGARTFFFDDTVSESAGFANRPYCPPTPPTSVPTLSQSSDELQPFAPSAHVRFDEMAERRNDMAQSTQREQTNSRSSIPMEALTSHMPFILAFESEVIAEQFSIIEKDALDEVDWKDLISLKWVQRPPAIHNWADYLNKQDEYNGIDIAITRFNLVVKWVISECILTDSPGERARCITKYIHIATHCRRFRNFASCYQITVALLSTVLSSLHKTWALVSVAEKVMLERLELLCQPTRNFHNLRVEMEASSMERGCVPFIGLYTHDLKLNAQKSATIDAAPHGTEPLVNFERYQTAASIVKSLLRLIEASSKYIFRPHPEALSRCLWLAALEDAEIRARCKGLE